MTTVVFVIVAAITLATLFRVLRSGHLREKYAVLWIVVGLAVVVIGVWPGFLNILADWLGVEVPSNLLFFLAIVLLLGVSLHLSLAVSKLEAETRTLAEEIAMLWERTERASVAVEPAERGPAAVEPAEREPAAVEPTEPEGRSPQA